MAPSYNPVPFFQNFSGISMTLNDTYKDNTGVPHTQAIDANYSVLATPSNASGYYKVALDEKEAQGAVSYTFYYLPNGTLSIVTFLGKNETGSGLGFYAIFLQVTFELLDASSHSLQFELSSAVHILNVTSKEIGMVPANITYYTPNHVPFVDCGQGSNTINSELIGVGQFTGVKTKLLVLLDIIATPFGAEYPMYLTVGVLSVTKA